MVSTGSDVVAVTHTHTPSQAPCGSIEGGGGIKQLKFPLLVGAEGKLYLLDFT